LRPKLSIITPSLNQAAFIERTIKSVLDQGYPNLEYLIVDGGSDDGSVEIIKRYEDKLAWWVSESDAGQTDAINKGIRRATGDVIAYINSDDYYFPGAFDAALGALEGSDARWAAGASHEVDDKDRPVRIGVWQPELPSSVEGVLPGRHWWSLVPWCVPQPSSFWRRDIFEEFGGFREDLHYAFDAEFMLRLAYGGAMPVIVEKVLAARVEHPDQKSVDMTPFYEEIDTFPATFAPRMTKAELRKLSLLKAMRAGGFFFLREHVWYRVLRLGGALLGLLPDRARPPIRDRDRGDVTRLTWRPIPVKWARGIVRRGREREKRREEQRELSAATRES
jgi:glycosyltransferase involved in cell wall biosynthesis